jgi:hypothetical protein
MVIPGDMSIPSFQTNFSLRVAGLVADKKFADHMTPCLFVTRKQSIEIKSETKVLWHICSKQELWSQRNSRF